MPQPTILIADDHPSHLQLMEITLFAEGYDLVTVDDGIKVLEYLKHHTPDLIILDTETPHLTGFELCARIKGVTRLIPVPVILVTTHMDPSVAMNGRLVHADIVLEKPVGTDRFQRIVKHYLRRLRLDLRGENGGW